MLFHRLILHQNFLKHGFLVQANEYRARHNDFQLYAMLMRLARYQKPSAAFTELTGRPWLQRESYGMYRSSEFTKTISQCDHYCCSLVVETIPLHKDFNKADPQYQSLRKVGRFSEGKLSLVIVHRKVEGLVDPAASCHTFLAKDAHLCCLCTLSCKYLVGLCTLQALLTRHIVELETLKVQLKLKHGTDSSIWADQSKSHSPDTVQLSTSNLPDLDWDNLAQHPSPVGQPERAADSSIPFDGNGQASPAHGTSAQPFSLLDGPQTSHAPPQSFPKLPGEHPTH